MGILSWLNWAPKPVEDRSQKKATPQGVAFRATMAGVVPGGWATDHREESMHFTGFNYIAIHAIASQVSGATVTAFADGPKQLTNQSRRKAIRAQYKSLDRYKSIYGKDQQVTTPLENDHPLLKLLKKPNPYETGAMFRYRQAQQMRLTGTCLVWNVPSQAGTTCQRYVLPTAMCTPVMPTTEMPYGGWRVSPTASRYAPIIDNGFNEGAAAWVQVLGKIISADQVQMIRYPHPFWLNDGQSPTSAGSLLIDANEAVNIARSQHMQNGCDPSVVISGVELGQDELDVVQAQVQKKYAGPQNSGKVMMFGSKDVEVNVLSASPKDMGYAEGFEQTKAAVYSLQGTPEVATGGAPSGAFAAYWASMKAWRHATVQPLCDMLAESDTEVLASQFGEGITIEIESAQVNDDELEEKSFSANVQSQCFTVNEMRAVRGYPPLPGPEGDEICGKPPAQAAGPSGAEPGADNEPPGGINDMEAGPPETPFMRKSLRAAFDAVESADKEWLESRLKGWITLKPHGEDSEAYVHVLVDGDGKIMSGPKGMEGLKVSELATHRQHGEERPTKEPDTHGGLIQHLEKNGHTSESIESVKNHVKDKNGVVIVHKGKVSFVDAFHLLTGNRDPHDMIANELKGKRGEKFAITNATAKRKQDDAKFENEVAEYGTWDSGNLTDRQRQILSRMVQDGRLTKRRGTADETTADGIPTIYEPVGKPPAADVATDQPHDRGKKLLTGKEKESHLAKIAKQMEKNRGHVSMRDVPTGYEPSEHPNEGSLTDWDTAGKYPNEADGHLTTEMRSLSNSLNEASLSLRTEKDPTKQGRIAADIQRIKNKMDAQRNEAYDAMLKKWKRDGRGEISFQEFQDGKEPANAATEEPPKRDPVAAIRAAFDKFDGKDGLPGYAMIPDVRKESGLSKEEFDSTLAKLRRDGHISLSIAENRFRPTKDEVENSYYDEGDRYPAMANKRGDKPWGSPNA